MNQSHLNQNFLIFSARFQFSKMEEHKSLECDEDREFIPMLRL